MDIFSKSVAVTSFKNYDFKLEKFFEKTQNGNKIIFGTIRAFNEHGREIGSYTVDEKKELYTGIFDESTEDPELEKFLLNIWSKECNDIVEEIHKAKS